MEVAVLGAGYAGLPLARKLERLLPDGVTLRLVDETGEHLIQHELHRLIRYPSLRDDLGIPLDDLVSRAEVIESRVTSVDEERREVALSSGERLQPDVLAICLGGVTGMDIIPGVAANADPLKRIDHASQIRSKFGSLSNGDRILVGGAGLAGIQVAGELAAARDEGDRDLEVIIIEQAPHVAPTFPTTFRHEVASALADAGITVRTNEMIERVGPDGAILADGTHLTAEQVVWTGGITGPDATANRRLPVRSDLRVTDRTFALGDAAQVVDDNGTRVPAAAQSAVRQAPVAAENIDRLVTAVLDDQQLVFEPRLSRYVHSAPGWVVSIGDDAVAMLGDDVLRGRPARAVKASITGKYLGSIGEIQRAMDAIATDIGWMSHRAPSDEWCGHRNQ